MNSLFSRINSIFKIKLSLYENNFAAFAFFGLNEKA
jgi:hypothetical protein